MTGEHVRNEDIRGAFEGVRVIDFTQIEQGPVGTQVLADFGADVIKIERIDVGDMQRTWGSPVSGNLTTSFIAVNRNKKSLSLNLKHPEAKQIVYQLVERGDVVASNFRPGVMERLGFGYEPLSQINPRIIVAYSSGYGQSGPYRDRPGQDLLAQAMGGLAAITGQRDGPPVAAGTYVADYLGGMFLAMGIMIALAAREKTGRGQVVDSCLLNAAIVFHLMEDTDFLITGKRQGRAPLGICHDGVEPLYAIYQAGDGQWLATAGGFVPDPWRRTCIALDMGDELANDPRFQTFEGMVAHAEMLQPILAAAYAKFTREEAIKRLEAQELFVAPVNEQPDVYADPQVLHNEMMIEFEQPGVGKLRTVGIPIKLSKTPGVFRLAPPTVGQHNEEILGALGYSAAEIERLQREGAVGAENRKAGEPVSGCEEG